uniref:Ras-related protein Rab-33 n=1 Tax=Steinernema glaseri TaxID=37863 RepID=A0A1I7Y200_9BILA
MASFIGIGHVAGLYYLECLQVLRSYFKKIDSRLESGPATRRLAPHAETVCHGEREGASIRAPEKKPPMSAPVHHSAVPVIPAPTMPTVASQPSQQSTPSSSSQSTPKHEAKPPACVPYPSATPAPETTVPRPVSTVKPVSVNPVSNLHGTYNSKRVFKVIIIGDAGVGKTCLSFRFCNGRFPGQTEATIGVDFRERSVVIDKELLRVQLWDTAGQERYRQSIVAHYYRGVNAVVFVYDVSNPESFRSLGSWIQECRTHAVSASDDVPHILIGNKCDLEGPDRVKTDYAQMFADQNDMALFETSALADSEADHVESIFLTLVHKLRQSKPMHVQSDTERAQKEQRLLLKSAEAAALQADQGWCC